MWTVVRKSQVLRAEKKTSQSVTVTWNYLPAKCLEELCKYNRDIHLFDLT